VALCQARISTKPLWGFSSSNPYHSQSRAEQYTTLKYLLIIDFPKFDSLMASEMALCGNLGPKCQNLFPLVSD
jgi:hypothetical protein